MKRIFFLLLTTLALFGCQNEHKNNSKTMNCYVRFDADTNLSTAEASLVEDQTKKLVEFPDGTTFQKMPMKLVPNYGLTYQYEYHSNFVPEPSFAWSDEQNIKQVYTGHLDSIAQVSFGSPGISMSKATTLSWKGAALSKGETLLFMWQNAASGESQTLEVSSTNPQPLIDIPAEKLKKLSPGKWSLYLVRKKLSKQVVGQFNVNCISEYYTKPIQVTVTK